MLRAAGLAKSYRAPSGAPQTFTITVATVEARTVQRTVETTGSLLAWEEAVLNTSIAGTVARLLVDLGDRVEAGQILAELDTREYLLGVEQAEAALQSARSQLERARAQAAAAEPGGKILGIPTPYLIVGGLGLVGIAAVALIATR